MHTWAIYGVTVNSRYNNININKRNTIKYVVRGWYRGTGEDKRAHEGERQEEVVVEAAAAVEVMVVEVAAGVAEGVAAFISSIGGSAGVVRRDEDSVEVVAATRKDGKWLVLVSEKGYYFTDTNTLTPTPPTH